MDHEHAQEIGVFREDWNGNDWGTLWNLSDSYLGLKEEVPVMKYWCYSEICAVVKECESCGEESLEYGTEYDWEDFSLEHQERFVYYGECCVCGLTQVEQ